MGVIITSTYVVADWRKTRCPVDCDEAVQYGPACPHQRWFPIHSLVQLRHDEEGVLLTAHCRPKKPKQKEPRKTAPARRTPGVWRHATKREWGTAVIAEEKHDTRVFRFEDGKMRTFRASHFHLMERIEGAEAPPEKAPEPRRSAIPRCSDDDPDNRCRHIRLALKAADGTLGVPGPDDTDDRDRNRILREKGLVELSNISHTDTDDRMPKCPNCGETWSVSRVEGDTYTCRSPVCRRTDRRGRITPWEFTLGAENKPPTAGRHEWTFDYLDGKRLR